MVYYCTDGLRVVICSLPFILRSFFLNNIVQLTTDPVRHVWIGRGGVIGGLLLCAELLRRLLHRFPAWSNCCSVRTVARTMLVLRPCEWHFPVNARRVVSPLASHMGSSNTAEKRDSIDESCAQISINLMHKEGWPPFDQPPLGTALFPTPS